MIPELGLIEGFFGTPWSWSDRSEAVRFLAPHGYRFYLYAPKADVFLRRSWQQPYPEAELAEIAAFAAHCREQGVRFGVGLTPFELHLQSESGWREKMADKLAQLDQAGLDDLAILFDDMRGDVPDLAERQAEIVTFAAERTGASRILYCPSYYSDDPVLDAAFGERPPRYLEQLGRLLDPSINIMWTGPEVCSREFSNVHLDYVATRIGRKPFLWDNYPVNDGAVMSRHLHLRAFTGRPAGIASRIAAHGINIASQPLLSRIPALTLADSYRLGEAYDYAAALDKAAGAVLGEALAEAVRSDLIALQDRGVDRLDDRRAVLRERYTAFDHPAAREILAWLDGAWAITGEEVQTQ